MRDIIFKILKKLRIIDDIKELKKRGSIIGKNTHIFNSYIDKTHPHLIEIGDNCTLTNCTLLTHDASTKKYINKSKVGCIKIEDNCFIGWGSIILPNVKIGKNCIVGAGAVVTKSIPENSVVAGNPARFIKRTDEYIEIQKKLIEIRPNFNVKYTKMTLKDKKYQKDVLKKGIIGFDI